MQLWQAQVIRWRQSPLQFVLEALFRITEEQWKPWTPGTPRPEKAPVGPELWQGQFLKDVGAAIEGGKRRFTVRAGHGVGKAQPKSLEIDTPTGRRKFGELRPGDWVFGARGQPVRVTAVFDRGVRPVCQISFHDGTSTIACDEHLWSVRGRNERRYGRNDWRVMSTAEIREAGTHRRNGLSEARQWEIPVVGAVEYPFQWVPVDPYTLGVWIGDGTKHTGLLTTNDDAVVERIRSAGYQVERQNWSKLTPDKAGVWCIYGLAADLGRIGVKDMGSHERSIPEQYKYNIPDVRAELLRGLFDSDGWVSPNGLAQYTTVSKQLANDVAWLIRSLGGVARINGGKPKTYVNAQGVRVEGRPAYAVTATMPDGFVLFHLPRKRERVRPTTQKRYIGKWIDTLEPAGDAECMCIAVDAADHLYVTNDFIVTHNTTVEAWLVLWFVLFWRPLKMPITANSQDQLRDVVWAEIGLWWRQLPPFLKDLIEVGAERVTIKADPESAFAVARTARPERPEALQGFHSDNLAFLIEEASGIDDVIFQVAGGALSTENAWVFMFGNPTRVEGYFYRSHTSNRASWRCYHVPCSASSRVAPDYASEVAREYGEDSPVYRIRVLGEFDAGVDGVIPLGLIEAAMGRDIVPSDAGLVWGLDVARFGDDTTALAKRRGNTLVAPVREWVKYDLMQTCGVIAREWDETPYDLRPSAINVDVIGMGSGVVDRLSELGLPVHGVNVAEAASSSPGRYLRMRDELWFKAREWFDSKAVTMPRDDALAAELVGPKYKLESSGKIKVESKDDMKKRGIKSPNKADAFCLTFAGGDFNMHIRRATAIIQYDPFKIDTPEYERLVRRQEVAGTEYRAW